MTRRPAKPLAVIAALIAVAIATWLNRGTPSPEPVDRGAPPAAESRISGVPAAERAQLDATLRLIEAGGPFPYKQDGTVFGNREGHLPAQPRGYYREYTVPTQGASNRGARRVVRGRNGETYYTNDHYQSFVRLDE